MPKRPSRKPKRPQSKPSPISPTTPERAQAEPPTHAPSGLRALEERLLLRFAVLDNVVRDLTRRLVTVEKRAP